MSINVSYEDVLVGDALPEWTRTTDLMHWNRFAAVNDEFVYIHMDDDAGRRALNDQGAFGMGNLRYAYLLNALRDWAGDEAVIREVRCQFRVVNQKNDVLTVRGEVVQKLVVEGERTVVLDLHIYNQEGVDTTPARATIIFPN